MRKKNVQYRGARSLGHALEDRSFEQLRRLDLSEARSQHSCDIGPIGLGHMGITSGKKTQKTHWATWTMTKMNNISSTEAEIACLSSKFKKWPTASRISQIEDDRRSKMESLLFCMTEVQRHSCKVRRHQRHLRGKFAERRCCILFGICLEELWRSFALGPSAECVAGEISDSMRVDQTLCIGMLDIVECCWKFW